MTTVLQSASADSYVAQAVPAYNNGAAKLLGISGFGDDSGRLIFIYFNRPFPLGVTVASATLTLRQKGAATGGSRTLEVRRVTAAWKESTVNYINRPDIVGALGTSAAQGDGGTDGRPWTIDVTAHMQEIADGAAWYGFRVATTNATLLYFHSSRADQYQPVLEVEWSEAPTAPALLAPSNGRAVSIARPTLRFDFTDIAGDTSMQAYQVQTNPTNSFTSPAYDSGTVASSLPQHTLTADLAVAATLWWRARTQDGAGLWSDWSTPVSFTRTAKPTVAITNPVGTVSETTPPISWTVTGQTQRAYQVFLTDPVDTATVLWTSRKVTAADTALTIPDQTPPLLVPGSSYGLTVRIWDTVDRESTPGDTVYTDASTTFIFDLSDTVDPVTDLTVTITPNRPEVTVGFSRTSAADSYVLLRDGTPTATATAADLLVSGTTYAWKDVLASPRHQHTWSVACVVNGVTSDANPTATGTTEPTGVWLLTLDGEHAVFIGGESPIRYQPSELSSVRRPIGAGAEPVLRTQAVYRREGSLSGNAKPFGDQTLDDVRDTWAALFSPDPEVRVYPAGKPMALVDVDETLKVVPYQVLATPKHEFVDRFEVGFNFFGVR